MDALTADLDAAAPDAPASATDATDGLDAHAAPGADAMPFPDAASPAPDAATAPDAGVARDAAAPDANTDGGMAGFPDAARPDAMTFPDAMPRDTGIRDGGPDSGVDGGCAAPPFAVGPAPASVGSISVGLSISTSALVADFDDDGFDEIAVGSEMDGQIAIIDFEACSNVPTVTLGNLFVGPTGLALARDSNGARIVSTLGGQVRLTTYSGPNRMITTTTVTPGGGFDFFTGLAVHPSASEIIVNGPRMIASSAGYASGTVSAGFAFGHTLGENGIGSPAYITSAAAAPRTIIMNETGVVITRPDLGTDVTITLPGASPRSAAVTIAGTPQSMTPNAGFSTVGYTSELTNGRGALSVIVVDPTAGTPLVQVEDLAGVQRFVSEPIVYSSPATNGFFAIRETTMASFHELTGCTLRPLATPAGVSCGGVVSVRLAGTVAPTVTPITAYVSGAADPDLAVTTSDPGRGVLTFYRPTLMTVGAPVPLDDGAIATPGITTTFLSRYNVAGTVMFIPLSSGAVELVAWRRPTVTGMPQALWTQSRGGPRRSGRL